MSTLYKNSNSRTKDAARKLPKCVHAPLATCATGTGWNIKAATAHIALARRIREAGVQTSMLVLLGLLLPFVISAADATPLPAAAATQQPAIAQAAAPDAQLLQDAAKALRPDGRNRSTKPEALTLAPDATGLTGNPMAEPTPSAAEIARSLTQAEPLRPSRGIAQTSYWQANKVWIISFAVVVLALAGWLIYWQRKRARRPIPVDPKERALRQIAEAAAQSDAKRFASDVSDAVRTYIESRCGIRATEQTTEEFLHDVRRGNLLPQDAIARFARLLELCDLAKFAQQGLDYTLREELSQSACALVDTLAGNAQTGENTRTITTQTTNQPATAAAVVATRSQKR